MKVTSRKKEETETKINTISTILKTTRERRIKKKYRKK
jgi:hypothetical protein